MLPAQSFVCSSGNSCRLPFFATFFGIKKSREMRENIIKANALASELWGDF